MSKTPSGTELARAFMPARDFDLSKRFYEALGFTKVLDEFGDVDDIHAYAADDEWSRFLSGTPQPYRREDAVQLVARQARVSRGECVDEVHYGLLRAEWPRAKGVRP